MGDRGALPAPILSDPWRRDPPAGYLHKRADLAGSVDTARHALGLPVIPSRLIAMWVEIVSRRIS